MRAHALAAGARAPAGPGLARTRGHRRAVRPAPGAGGDRAGMRVPRATGGRVVRAHVRLGVAARTRARTAALPTMQSRRWAMRWRRSHARSSDRYVDYLPRQRYPIRVGPTSVQRVRPRVRAGTTRAAPARRDLPRCCGRQPRCAGSAADRDAPAAWEPSGTDFLSPSLIEADLMRRVLDRGRRSRRGSRRSCRDSIAASRRRCSRRSPSPTAAIRLLVHLDGLNLSRAWCMRGIASARCRRAMRAAPGCASAAAVHRRRRHGRSLASGDYMGEHWLATFACLR